MAGGNLDRVASAMLAVLLSQPICTGVGAGSDASPACRPDTVSVRAVTAVPDAATLRLDDGKELLLPGILPPYAPGSGLLGWSPERDARTALERLVLGRDIALGQAAARPDRYGRTSAQAFVATGNGAPVWVQGELVAQGHARVHATPGQTSCLAELLGSYQIVQGRISAIEEKHSGLVLKLTARTRLTFRVHVPRGAEWRQQAVTLKALLHRRIEARGWIEWRHGPMLTVADPGLIQAVAGGSR